MSEDHQLRELRDDVREYYNWAEKQEKPTVVYGVSYHLFQVERSIAQLNDYIKTNIKTNQQ